MLYSTISPGKMKINIHWILKNLCTWYMLRTTFTSEEILLRNKKYMYMYVKKVTGIWTWLITWSNPVKPEGLLRWLEYVPNYILIPAGEFTVFTKHISKAYQVVSLSPQPTPSFHLHRAGGEYHLFCPKKFFSNMIISSELHV